MPWNLIVTGGGIALLLVAWLFRRRHSPSTVGTLPDVGQPPEDAEPIVEPRMQDIGFASYELPLPATEPDPDRNPG